MTIDINGYEVKITARYKNHARANKRDTMDLLNEVCIWVSEAADAPINIEFELSDLYKRISTEIYKQLNAAGCYDHLADDRREENV